MASCNGNLKIAEKLIQLGLDVNEAHFVGTFRALFLYSILYHLFSAAILLCTGQLSKGIST